MTTTHPSSATLSRLGLLLGLVVFLVLSGTGLAHAFWTTSATTTATATAGNLTAELDGTAGLSAQNINTTRYTPPVQLILYNTSTVPLAYSLALTHEPGTLDPAQVELTLWTPTSTTCPTTVPTTGTVTGTLAAPPALPSPAVTGTPGSTTAVCVATRFTGTLIGAAGKSLTATPHLTGRLDGTDWSTTIQGGPFTQTIAPAPGPVTNLRCANRDVLNLLGIVVGGQGIRLTWGTVTGATGYEVRSATGAILAKVSTTSVDLAQSVDPGSSVTVVAMGPTGYSPVVSYPVHRQSLTGLRCGSA